MNLIVAVVVDVSAESRDKVFYSRAEELEKEESEHKQVLERIFNKIDSNHDGAWTCEELEQGPARWQSSDGDCGSRTSVLVTWSYYSESWTKTTVV